MAFSCGTVGIIFTALLQGPSAVNIVPTRIFGLMVNYLLDAIPLFIFMACILERGGLIGEIYEMVHQWLGWLKGGVATASVAACTMMAAMVGVIGASEVTMGVIAFPEMLRRRYDKYMAAGSILAGGTLGILIPPSAMLIVYGMVDNVSIGQLYAGAFLPGFLLAALYISLYLHPVLSQPKDGASDSQGGAPFFFRKDEGLHADHPRGHPDLPRPRHHPDRHCGAHRGSRCGVRRGFRHPCLPAQTEMEGSGRGLRKYPQVLGHGPLDHVRGKRLCGPLRHGGRRGICDGCAARVWVDRWVIMWIMQFILIFLGCFIDWVGIVMLSVPDFRSYHPPTSGLTRSGSECSSPSTCRCPSCLLPLDMPFSISREWRRRKSQQPISGGEQRHFSGSSSSGWFSA